VPLNEFKGSFSAMTMHNAGIELARNRVPINYLSRSVINAELFDPNTAILAGFLDQVVAEDKLMSTAVYVAKQMLTLSIPVHHLTKLKTRKEILIALDTAIKLDSEVSDIA
jgi:enoyl-CoA hydratase